MKEENILKAELHGLEVPINLRSSILNLIQERDELKKHNEVLKTFNQLIEETNNRLQTKLSKSEAIIKELEDKLSLEEEINFSERTIVIPLLENQNKELKAIIKEAREYIHDCCYIKESDAKNLYNILDKDSDKYENIFV